MAEVVVGGLLTLVGAVLGTILREVWARRAAKEQQALELSLAQRDHHQRERQAEEARREKLRVIYIDLIRAARRTREASVKWAKSVTAKPINEQDLQAAKVAASAAYDDFIEQYHLLYLVGDQETWERSRELRRVLYEMITAAERGNETQCIEDLRHARHARQNLAGALRVRLGLQPLQDPKRLPERFTVAGE